MSNYYYHPEAHGLEIVAKIDYSDRNYVYDLRVVFRRKATGELLTARDVGCSCPTPFENTPLESYSYSMVRSEALEEGRKPEYRGDSIIDFLENLQRLEGGGI